MKPSSNFRQINNHWFLFCQYEKDRQDQVLPKDIFKVLVVLNLLLRLANFQGSVLNTKQKVVSRCLKVIQKL